MVQKCRKNVVIFSGWINGNRSNFIDKNKFPLLSIKCFLDGTVFDIARRLCRMQCNWHLFMKYSPTLTLKYGFKNLLHHIASWVQYAKRTTKSLVFLTPIFSRRFIKWNAAIVIFSIHTNWPKRLSKVLQNFKVSNWTIWSRELNYKLFLFQRNTQYRARLKAPRSVFSALRLFFEKFLMSPKGPLQFFLMFCDRMDVEKSSVVWVFRKYFDTFVSLILCWHSDVLLLFLNLGYGADLCRSWLVHYFCRF